MVTVALIVVSVSLAVLVDNIQNNHPIWIERSVKF